ncbi:hypothetical protein [Wenxinia marina]|uniref:Wenxma_17, whole genome shotgun sequence n=1 Tax=Wenxinia marina DSM 24838 TaxID=1123501 RepID=A0A0D0P8N7_9RHOB|nr:hypothetical protein [Wenxinia marina]KIQ67931.1 hypothetical protein Wenmar_03385 [Wenxinia marina DSM 24838]GGL76102.1 hypothetical protein GCM10011392_33370 [Wenxinia marina]
MTTLTAFIADVTCFEVVVSLLAVGVAERLLYLLPASVVGPGGWLLDTGPAAAE